MKFIKSVIQEMKLVTWPTAKENRHDTWIVVSTSIIFSVFFAAVDFLISKALGLFITKK